MSLHPSMGNWCVLNGHVAAFHHFSSDPRSSYWHVLPCQVVSCQRMYLNPLLCGWRVLLRQLVPSYCLPPNPFSTVLRHFMGRNERLSCPGMKPVTRRIVPIGSQERV